MECRHAFSGESNRSSSCHRAIVRIRVRLELLRQSSRFCLGSGFSAVDYFCDNRAIARVRSEICLG